jgi:hypothetical protein
VVFEPEPAGRDSWVDTSIPPPLCFIAAPMDVAMMTAAERNCEFIADLAAKCPALGEPEMMRIRRPPAADQARMLGDGSDMIPVTQAAGFGHRQRVFVDRVQAFSPLRF